jgi:hypothetical protein
MSSCTIAAQHTDPMETKPGMRETPKGLTDSFQLVAESALSLCELNSSYYVQAGCWEEGQSKD